MEARWTRIASSLLVPILAMAAIGVSVSFLGRDDTEFDSVYRQAARELADGADFYAMGGYAYPPFAAWLMIPLTHLDTMPARWIWLAINLVACCFLIRAGWVIAGGSRLLRTNIDFREQAIFWCGLGSAFFYLLNAFNHTQTDIVIGALVMGGCLALVRGQALTSAIWFGLASAFKCTPLLWIVYFVWRGRVLPAATVVGVFVGVNLLPNLANPGPDGTWWLTCWYERYLSGVTRSTAEIGAWHTFPRYNQSLNGAVQRLFFVDPGWSDGDLHETPRARTVDRQLVKFGVLGVEAALVLGCLFVMGRFWRSTLHREHTALDCSVICILMLLLSPMSGKAHFGILILPGFYLARQAIAHASRAAVVTLALSVLLVLSGRLTGAPALLACWWGNVMWHAIVLLAGCLVAIHLQSRGRREANTPTVAAPSLQRAA